MRDSRLLLFGPFRVDLADERLWCGENALRLTNKAFAVLRYLVEHAEQLSTKEALLDAVWPATYVSEAALAMCIRELRQALGDSARTPQFIETVRGRGYRFLAPVTATGQSPTEREVVLQPLLTPPSFPFSPQSSVLSPVVLVGREAELVQLQQWFVTALQGERQLGFITGEAGIGKTALVDAFVAQVETAERLWIGHGQCIEQYGAGEPYLPVLEALGRLCRGPEGAHLVDLLRQQAPSWLVQLPALLTAAEREALHRHGSGVTRERMLRELAEAVETLTAEWPLVLVLEDLHWSDASTLDWLAYVARRRDRARLLVLGTYRPVEAIVRAHPLRPMTQELRRHGQCAELVLDYLSEASVAAYLARRCGGTNLPERLTQSVYQRTNGNPLFMVTVVDELVQQGVLQESAQGWEGLEGLAAAMVEVPETLRQLIEHQLGQVDPDGQELLEATSVAGMTFAAAAIAAGIDAEEVEVEARCEALARRDQFIQPRGTAEWPDGTVTARYGFIHALYQEVLYDRIPAGRRVRLHQRIGARQETGYGDQAGEIAAELAVHFVQGRDAQRAVQYLRYAGENAEQRSAYQEAIACYEQALGVLQRFPEPCARAEQAIDLHFALYRVCMPLGAYDRIFTALREAEALAEALDDQRRLWQIYSQMSHCFRVMGSYDHAVTYARRAVGIITALGEVAVEDQPEYRLGMAYYALGEYHRAIDCFRKRLRSLQNRAGRMPLSRFPPVWNRISLVRCLAELGAFGEGIALGQEAVRIAEVDGDPYGRIGAYGGIGSLHLRQGALPPAVLELECALELCQRWHILDWFPKIATFLGAAYALSGRVAKALQLCEQAVEQERSLGNKGDLAFSTMCLSEALLLSGRVLEATDHALRALDLTRAHRERGTQAWVCRSLGEIATQSAPLDVELAATHYQQALALADELDMRPLQAHCHRGLGILYGRVGRVEHARIELSTASELYRTMEMTFWVPQVEAALARVE